MLIKVIKRLLGVAKIFKLTSSWFWEINYLVVYYLFTCVGFTELIKHKHN